MIILTRGATTAKGTFGILTMDGEPLCVTCEDPWNDNKTNISCIPDGEYNCSKFSGTKFKDVWEIKNVPGRSAILIHAGNTIEDTHGCVLVGRSFNGRAITESQAALAMLRKKLPDNFTLTVRGLS